MRAVDAAAVGETPQTGAQAKPHRLHAAVAAEEKHGCFCRQGAGGAAVRGKKKTKTKESFLFPACGGEGTDPFPQEQRPLLGARTHTKTEKDISTRKSWLLLL